LEQTRAQDNNRKRESGLVAIIGSLARTPDIRAKILENVYKMLIRSRIMCGVKMWGLD
jgi:hypothetical protein